MKTLLFHITIICLLFSCNTKKEVNEISLSNAPRQINIDDSIVYSAVKYLLKNQSSNPFLKYEKVLESAQMPFFFEFKKDYLEIVKLDSIFDLKDIEYMQTQKNQFYTFKFKKGKFGNKVIISKDSLDLAKNYPYCYISFPIFNLRKDKLIIWAGYYSAAFTAEGAIFIYQKNGKSWEIIKVLNQTVS